MLVMTERLCFTLFSLDPLIVTFSVKQLSKFLRVYSTETATKMLFLIEAKFIKYLAPIKVVLDVKSYDPYSAGQII
ncbi:hypothetical protein EAF00_011753 [Botryotinia globosa]|nr:hypothetical protein EAF00_011753 [Botryotinia globosa]